MLNGSPSPLFVVNCHVCVSGHSNSVQSYERERERERERESERASELVSNGTSSLILNFNHIRKRSHEMKKEFAPAGQFFIYQRPFSESLPNKVCARFRE